MLFIFAAAIAISCIIGNAQVFNEIFSHFFCIKLSPFNLPFFRHFAENFELFFFSGLCNNSLKMLSDRFFTRFSHAGGMAKTVNGYRLKNGDSNYNYIEITVIHANYEIISLHARFSEPVYNIWAVDYVPRIPISTPASKVHWSDHHCSPRWTEDGRLCPSSVAKEGQDHQRYPR